MRNVPLSVKELASFLQEANHQTYANKDAPHSPPSRPGAKDYHFEKGSLSYYDSYFGSRDFLGEETVSQNGQVIWGMNYRGHIRFVDILEKDVYKFLRTALMQNPGSTIPIRGPVSFIEGSWRYQLNIYGDLDNFRAEEEIWLEKKCVYRCQLHGGYID